jgi:hypothetical protein
VRSASDSQQGLSVPQWRAVASGSGEVTLLLVRGVILEGGA